MVALIQRDTIEVYRADGTADEHGWVEPPILSGPEGTTDLIATLPGTLQISAGLAGSYVPTAAEAGDSGPHDPRSARRADAYFDVDADVRPGDVLVTRGDRWQVASVMIVEDPRDSGELDCLWATCETLWSDA